MCGRKGTDRLWGQRICQPWWPVSAGNCQRARSQGAWNDLGLRGEEARVSFGDRTGDVLPTHSPPALSGHATSLQQGAAWRPQQTTSATTLKQHFQSVTHAGHRAVQGERKFK